MLFPKTNTDKPPIGPRNCMKNVINNASNNPVTSSNPNIQSGLCKNCPERI